LGLLAKTKIVDATIIELVKDEYDFATLIELFEDECDLGRKPFVSSRKMM